MALIQDDGGRRMPSMLVLQVTDLQVVEVQFIENAQFADVPPCEEAARCREEMRRLGVSRSFGTRKF